MTNTLDLRVAPLGRVEGDLDLKVKITDGVVTDAWTEAAMFRGFEIILRGKDPQAGLIMTPRICGICGGSHLYKACYAIDTAWATHVPPNATRVRNIAQACETLLSIPRWFYAIFAIDLVNAKYANAPSYAEAVRRFSPFVGTSYEPGLTLSAKPVEIYAIFGGQWPHSSFMIPGGVMGAPTLSDVTRSTAIIDAWNNEWLEKQWLGATVDEYLDTVKTYEDLLHWGEGSEAREKSDLAFYIKYALEIGLDKYGQGYGNFLATGTFLSPELYQNPTIEGRNAALGTRAGVYAGGEFFDFDQARVTEDITHSYYRGTGSRHPFDGETDPIDPADGEKQGKYTWAKAPRYDIPGKGFLPLEVGPLARQIVAGRPGGDPTWQDVDGLILDTVNKVGPSVFVRTLARVHESAKYYKNVKKWLAEIDLHGSFYTKPGEPDGRGFGSTEAARGALSDWVVLEGGKIKNYQVITPTAWNIGPRDGAEAVGPMEKSFIGTPVGNPTDPVELGHVARSFDSCLVCTVHAYDGKTGRELASFRMDGMV